MSEPRIVSLIPSATEIVAARRAGGPGRAVRIISLNPMSLDDVWRVAEVLGVAPEGARLVAELKQRMPSAT
jgi:hypothetical protein